MKWYSILGIVIVVLIVLGIIISISAPDLVGFVTLGIFSTEQTSNLCDSNGESYFFPGVNLAIPIYDLNIAITKINYSTFWARNHVIFDYWSNSDFNLYKTGAKLYMKNGPVKVDSGLWMCLQKLTKTNATIVIYNP